MKRNQEHVDKKGRSKSFLYVCDMIFYLEKHKESVSQPLKSEDTKTHLFLYTTKMLKLNK